jgi:hypothetical protein
MISLRLGQGSKDSKPAREFLPSLLFLKGEKASEGGSEETTSVEAAPAVDEPKTA